MAAYLELHYGRICPKCKSEKNVDISELEIKTHYRIQKKDTTELPPRPTIWINGMTCSACRIFFLMA